MVCVKRTFKGMVMTMKLKYMGWVALSGLFAVSLVGCAAQSSQTAPAGSEQAVVQTEETQGPAAGQAAVDEQADAEADAATVAFFADGYEKLRARR